MQIAYRAFATVQQRQLYIAKFDSIEKLFYNTKMASLRRPEIGRQAQRIGRNAERRVITELEEAGWGTESNAELDYAGKTDARATCPAGRKISMQVSAKQKSSGTQRRLKKRGVIPVSIADLDTTKNCPRISMQPMPAQRGLPLQRNSKGLRIDGNCANVSTQSLEPTPAAYWTAIDICR